MLQTRKPFTVRGVQALCSTLFAASVLLGAAGCDSEKKAEDPAEEAIGTAEEAASEEKPAELAKAEVDAEVDAEADAVDPRVTQAIDIAEKIDAEPERADEILDAAGLDRDSLSSLFYEIAADPALSQAYEAARAA